MNRRRGIGQGKNRYRGIGREQESCVGESDEARVMGWGVERGKSCVGESDESKNRRRGIGRGVGRTSRAPYM